MHEGLSGLKGLAERVPTWAGRACALALLAPALLLAPGRASADVPSLPIVKPVTACEQLDRVDLGKATGTTVTARSTLVGTPKGTFCKVSGTVGPGNGFEIDLPVDRWTQRYVQSAQGNISVANAGTCKPATNGEMVVGVNSRTGSRSRAGWQSDPEQRLAFAYLLNHHTALIAKALIRAFYGQPPRFSYFSGCSGGGREVLIEIQRYPQDFDGVAVGAPNILLSVHNGGFFHGWEPHVNTRADGSLILGRDKLAVLHRAVVSHCAATAGTMDGILQMPSACTFDPAWVRCAPGIPDTANCLTSEQADVAQKLYRGATDTHGRGFDTAGYPPGSEMFWPLGVRAGGAGDSLGAELRYLLPLEDSRRSDAELTAAFRFDQRWYDKVTALAPLYNGANTDLRPFQRHGGKLLLWQGAADVVVQQQTTIAYYEGVRRELGTELTDSFLRFFLLPGVAHCGGGDGPAQVDVLSPLMEWVEQGRGPDMLVAGRPAGQRSGIPGERTPESDADRTRYPYATEARPSTLVRPIYRFPRIARYSGRGDGNDPASYTAAVPAVNVPQMLDSRATRLIAPRNQRKYRIENGTLVAELLKSISDR